jgi:hypothetical protein
MNATSPRSVAVVLAAVALAAAALTGCGPTDGIAVDTPSTTGSGAPVKPAPASVSPAVPITAPAPAPTSAPTPARTATPPAATTKPPKPVPAKTACSDKPPTPDEVDPQTFAVYRTEEITGGSPHINLILQHGRWGCPSEDSDGLPYITTGEDSRWALDQAAYITATNPITMSSASQHIGVQEFLDWVAAHPDSGLVFRYETGDDGAIHRLDEVYAP